MAQIEIRPEIVAEWDQRAMLALERLLKRHDDAGDRGPTTLPAVLSRTYRFGDRQVSRYEPATVRTVWLVGGTVHYGVSASTGKDTFSGGEGRCWIFRLVVRDGEESADRAIAEVSYYQHAEYGIVRTMELEKVPFSAPLLLEQACNFVASFAHKVTMAMEE